MQITRPHPWRLWLLVPAGVALVWLSWSQISKAYVSLMGWIFAEQRAFHQSLQASVGDFANEASLATGWAIVVGSFLYGIFHAAGPGHGKMILSTYLLARPERVGKSVALAAASSLVQGLVAIALVYGLFFVFGLVARDMKLAVSWSERLAFSLVMLVGLVLIWRAVKGSGLLSFARGKEHDNRHGLEHSHGHNHAHQTHDHEHAHSHDHHHHDHSHDHHHGHSHGHDHHDHHVANADGVCSSCGHAHVPTASQVEEARDWKTILGVVLSIGMRPCSGAVLVLVFARFAQIPWAGVMAVLAMSIGTAITVSALAVLSVKARGVGLRLLGVSGGTAQHVGNAIALAGGAVLIAMGYGLLVASFDAPVRSMGL